MFPVEGYHVVTLGTGDAPTLQFLLERCHVFQELVYGEPPRPDAAARLLVDLPEGKSLEDKLLFGLRQDGRDTLHGVLETIRGFPEPGDWFIGTLMLDPGHRNAGVGNRFVEAFERWAHGQGATALRLIVQEQNPGAVRFWKRRGYVLTGSAEQRLRGREQTLLRLRKPLD